jgi:integrase
LQQNSVAGAAWQPLRDWSAFFTEILTKQDEQISTLLEAVQPWAGAAYFFLAITGVRAGEAAGLKWSDVSFDDGCFKVVSSKGQGDLRERKVPMTRRVQAFLMEQHSEAKRKWRGKPQDHVFLNASDMPVTSSHLSRELRRTCKRIGLEGLTLHGLRHTYITRLAEAGCGLEHVRILVGHSNLKTTQGYLHVSDKEVLKAAETNSESREFNFKK